MKTGLLCALFGVVVAGCFCEATPTAMPRFDESGLLPDSRVRYEVRVRRNAATVTVNAAVELAVCVSFSEGCRVKDFDRPYPRFRQYEDSVEIQPYLRGGANEVLVQRRPDGDDETLYFEVIRVEGRTQTVLAEGKIESSDQRAHSVRLETPGDCAPPHLPDTAWLATFLDPLPEAVRAGDEEVYRELLIPPQTEEQRKNRADGFALLRNHPLIGEPIPASTLRQDHRSVPLTMNYSCENERLFVYPEDGGDLIIFAEIEQHEKPRGRSSTWSSTRVAELVFHDDRWYLGRLQSP